MRTNRNNINISFSHFEFSPDEISKSLNLKPTKAALRGDEYLIGPPDNKLLKKWEYNFWNYFVSIESNTWISELVDDFINDILIPRIEIIKSISKQSQCEFSIGLYYYDHWNPGFHFSKNQITFLSEIGADLDIDIYCLNSNK